METKICKICFKKKTIENYYKTKSNKDGRMGVCKICRSDKKKIDYQRNKDISIPTNLVRLHRVSKKHYQVMYDLLKLLKYDIKDGDIHQQFINKWNDEDVNMKYKERPKNSQNAFLPDGSINPNDLKNANNRKYVASKKNPTD